MLKPLFNNCLIELIDDAPDVYHGGASENLQKGILRDYQLISDHLTASTGYKIVGLVDYSALLDKYKDKIVYYQQYADSGAVIEKDGKKYALVPFYRLIAEDAK